MKRRYTMLSNEPDLDDLKDDEENVEDKGKNEEAENPDAKTFLEKELDRSSADKTGTASLNLEIMAQRQLILKETEEMEEKLKGENDENTENSEEDDEDDESEGDDNEDKSDDKDEDDDDLDDLDFDDPADGDLEEDSDDKESKDEPTKASNTPAPIKDKPFVKGWNYAKKLREQHKQRMITMQAFGFTVLDEPTEKEEDSDVVYVQEGVVESLTMLGELNRKYVSNTEAYIEKCSKSILKVNENITLLNKVVKDGEVTYTNKLITDSSMLSAVSLPTTSNPRETIKRIRSYIKEVNDIAGILVKTDFDNMKDVFLSKNFINKGDLIEYTNMLPGFVTVIANIPQFTSYIKTRASDYQYYTNKQDNSTEVYDVKGISITDDTDLIFLTEEISKLITDTGITVDILKVLNNGFKTYMDELNLLRIEVEDGVFDKLSDVDLDSKIKQFILFKMVIEICTVNVRIVVDYISGLKDIIESSTVLKQN